MALAALVTAMLAPADAAAISFSQPQSYDAGDRSAGIAVGQLDDDSNQDLAVTDAEGNDVWVLLGDGSGSFGSASTSEVGLQPEGVAIGDFDGDSASDLAVANSTSDTLSVLLGNGDGSFDAAMSLGAGFDPSSVATGDFDGDSQLDLAAANFASDNVSILLGNGDGSFGAAASVPAGDGPVSIATGDFDGDAKLDLATANLRSHTVSVLLGNGDGSFGAAEEFEVGSSPRRVAVADLDTDSDLDLAVANMESDNVSILLGNGDGSFGAATDSPAGNAPLSVAVADLNGDGKTDLATANNVSGDVSVLLGEGDGAFGAREDFPAGESPVVVSVGHFNGDSRPDLALADLGGGVSILLAQAEPSLAADSVGSASVGDLISNTATLAGGDDPTGTIAFGLYGPDDPTCSAAPVFEDTVTVDGNGDYESLLFSPDEPGTYRWSASYSGDTLNAPVVGACGGTDQEVTVTLHPPQCDSIAASTIVDRPLFVDLDCMGHGAPQFEVEIAPANGQISLFDSDTGRLVYTPDPGFTGGDSLSYRASNGGGASGTVELTLDVRPQPPSGDRVYWGKTGPGAIRTGSPDGSGVPPSWDLFGSPEAPNGVAIDAAAGRIYWADPEDGAIRYGSLDGSGAPQNLFSGEDEPQGLAIDPVAGKAYWASNDGGAIRVGNLDGSGTPQNLFGGEVGPTAVAIDPAANRIYWTAVGESLFSGAIRAGNLDGSGTPVTLFGSQFLPFGLALDTAAGKIYWADPGLAAIRVANLDGSGAPSTLFPAEPFPTGVAVDPEAGEVYWANFGSGEIRRGSVAGGPASPVFRGPETDLPAFVALLRPPRAAGSTSISGAGIVGQELRCGAGEWGPDALESFLYRAPTELAYSWLLDGKEVTGAAGSTYTPAEPGLYTCSVTGSNPAGSATQTSTPQQVEPAPPPPPPSPDPSPAPIATAACPHVSASPSSFTPAKRIEGRQVPGVRARIAVSTPAQLAIVVRLQFTRRDRSRSVDLGTHSLPNPGARNLRLPLPPSLRKALPLGKKVRLRLRIEASVGCGPLQKLRSRTIRTRVVKVLVSGPAEPGDSRQRRSGSKRR